MQMPETPARAPNRVPANAVANNIRMLDSPNLLDKQIVAPNNPVSLDIRCLPRGVNIAVRLHDKSPAFERKPGFVENQLLYACEETSSKVKLQLGQIKAKCVRTWLDLEHQTARLGVVELLRNIRSGCGI